MEFGGRLKDLRLRQNMTQSEFGETLGVTSRAIIYYETGQRIPKDMNFYKKVSERFGVPLESLIDEREEFVANAYAEGGIREKRKAEALVAEAGALFAGGVLTEEDKDAVFHALQEAYWFAKSENRKYAKRKRGGNSPEKI
ncbi:MAG: helix-turn-helix domain-containing protein [Oscillospiraceae bacterium]|nr:helix-turn-helix domain-containing protein [Oscillospiraceae bacterium]